MSLASIGSEDNAGTPDRGLMKVVRDLSADSADKSGASIGRWIKLGKVLAIIIMLAITVIVVYVF